MKKLIFIFSFLLSVCGYSQSLTVTAPADGAVWEGGTSQSLEWTSFNVDNIRIEVSYNGGSDWSVLSSAYPTSALSFAFNVPSSQTSCLFRITDILDPSVSATSGMATIPPAAISWIYPAEGDEISEGGSYTFQWNSYSADTIDMYYSTDEGVNWIPFKDNAVAGKKLAVLNVSVTGNLLFRAELDSDPSVSAVSGHLMVNPLPVESPVKFYGGSFDGYASASNLPAEVEITSPAGGESWSSGSYKAIEWTFENVGLVTIEHSTDGSIWNEIAAVVPASATNYIWQVAAASPTNYIRITDVSDPSVTFTSPSFEIPVGGISILYPQGDEEVFEGSSMTLMWNAEGAATVDISYSTDGGDSWLSIASAADADPGFYNWKIPAGTGDFLLKVTNSGDPSQSDEITLPVRVSALPGHSPEKYYGGSYDGYDSYSNEIPSLSLLTPSDEDTLEAGSEFSISWKYANLNFVKLEFSADNGDTWVSIKDFVYASALSASFTVPSIVTDTGIVRISNAETGEILDESVELVILEPEISLLYPVSGEELYPGSSYTIIWQSTGVGSVNLKYSSDNGNNWNVIASNNPSSGTSYYNWEVPAVASAGYLVAVEDVSGQAADTIPAPVSVIATPAENPVKFYGGSYDGYAMSNNIVNVLSPDGGETYVSGQTAEIAWEIDDMDTSSSTSKISAMSEVRIEYSADNGNNWTVIESQYQTSGSTYQWTVPLVNSNECLIKVTDLVHDSEYDISNNVFLISTVTGLNSNPEAGLYTYPNPSSGSFYIRTKDKPALLTSGGARTGIEAVKISGDLYFINAADLPSGLYIVENAEGSSKVFIR